MSSVKSTIQQSNCEDETLLDSDNPAWKGHDRSEVVRILIQALEELGYKNSAETLTRESNINLYSDAFLAFQDSVSTGEWSKAEAMLSGTNSLPLEEGVDKNDMLIRLYRKQYLRELELGDTVLAAKIFREKLGPLMEDEGYDEEIRHDKSR